MFYFIYSITEYFFQKGCIKLIKVDSKEITISTKNAISNQSCSRLLKTVSWFPQKY